MSEALQLELPQQQKRPSAVSVKKWQIFVLLVILLIAALFTAWWWINSGEIRSASAKAEGNLIPVISPVSTRLKSINVREGDQVQTGQLLVALDMQPLSRQIALAQKESMALKTAPDIVVTAQRLREAQDAEKEIVSRIALARQEEENLRALKEERVTEHVRAQLALRGLQDSGAGASEKLKNDRQILAKAEAEAKARKESAEKAFEVASRQRAALDRELGRIREQILNSQGTLASTSTNNSSLATVSSQDDEILSNIVAPGSGLIKKIQAKPGEIVAKNQTILLLEPMSSAGHGTFSCLAWFQKDYADRLKIGQACTLTTKDETLRGRIVQIFAPQTIPGQGGEALIPVRIAAEDRPTAMPSPGQPVDCVVRTRNLFGFAVI